MKLPVIQFSPVSHHLLPSRPKYSSQHSFLELPLSVFFTCSVFRRFTNININGDEHVGTDGIILLYSAPHDTESLHFAN
jgi:hypothetical protein